MTQIIRVAIQGDKASFHEIGAKQYYSYPIELVYCQSFEEVFILLKSGSVQKAFIAVYNSNHGEIKEVTELLRMYRPTYEGKCVLPIQQHIIGLAGATVKSVSYVVSHPVALSQCSLYIDTHFHDAAQIEYHDTSAAVECVKQLADPTVVAIGSEAAARLHELEIVCRSIQDDVNNATTFHSFSYLHLQM